MESDWRLTYNDSSERAFTIDRRKAVQVEWTKAKGAGDGERGIELFVDDQWLWVWCFVAPHSDFEAYRPTFQQIIDSLSFRVDETTPKIPGRATIVARSDPPRRGHYRGRRVRRLHAEHDSSCRGKAQGLDCKVRAPAVAGHRRRRR